MIAIPEINSSLFFWNHYDCDQAPVVQKEYRAIGFPINTYPLDSDISAG